jgi:hypothetical protein
VEAADRAISWLAPGEVLQWIAKRSPYPLLEENRPLHFESVTLVSGRFVSFRGIA